MADNFQNISNSLGKKQISRAIFYLKRWNQQFNDKEEYNKEADIQSIADTYNSYLDNFSQPSTLNSQQHSTLNSQLSTLVDPLIVQCYRLADTMKLNELKTSDNTFESQQLIHAQRPQTTEELKSTFDQIRAYNHEIEVQLSPNRSKYEDNLNSIFLYFWLNEQFTKETANLYRKYIVNTEDNEYQLGKLVQPLVISALTLNLLRNFSEDNLLLLTEAVASPDVVVKVRAYIGIVLVLAKYSQRYSLFQKFNLIINEEIINRQKRLDNVYTVIIDLIRTLETEQLSLMMKDEIVPEILKRNPEKNLKDGTPIFDIEALAGNPDWTDYKNSLEYKIVKLSELQAEGSDANYHTFQPQKHLPFFKTLSHWFLPFDTEWSDIARLFKQSSLPIEKMLRSRFLCDSDCYSFCFTFAYFPSKSQKDINNIIAKNLPTDDEDDDEPDFKQDNRLVIEMHNYIHTLYRFFRLNAFDIENAFDNITDYPETIIPVLFKDDFNLQLEIANFYFNKQQYQPALTLYRQLQQILPSGEIFQKMGYAEEHLGNRQQALRYYTIADTYTPDNVWTLKRMIACSDSEEQRAGIYDKILLIDPDNKQALMGKAKQLAGNKEYDQAVEILYKLDFLYPDTPAIERQLALCAAFRHDFDTSIRYWIKLNQQEENSNDLMNTAHIYFIQHNIPEALTYYQKSWEKTSKKSDFWTTLRNDTQTLINAFNLTEQDIHILNEILINRLYN